MSTATKQDLLKQIESLQQTVRNMGEPRKLVVSSEHSVNGIPARNPWDMPGAADLHHVDHVRRCAQREMAHQLAEELIRSGTVKFTETIEPDYRRFAHTVRIRAELRVC